MKSDGPYAADFGPFHGRVWLNTAHQGALPKASVEAALAALDQKTRPYLLREEDFFAVPGRLRTALGNLIGTEADDVILGNSTSYGLDLLANGMRWEPGDEILLVDGDFPADVFPWMVLRRQGVTIRFIRPKGRSVDPDELAEQISARTRLFCTTWVNSFTGYAIDLDAIGRVCRKSGVIFVVNASQALGARVLDVSTTAVDAVVCCGYKWLCGPYATGFCWLVPAVRERLCARHAYWLAMQEGKPLDRMRDYTPRTDLGARAWDVFCTANFLNFTPWTESVEYLLAAGPENVAAYDATLVSQLIDGLDEDRFELVSPREGPERSTLTVLRPRKEHDAGWWHARLASEGLDVAVREGNLRISPHLHNSPKDIEKLLRALAG